MRHLLTASVKPEKQISKQLFRLILSLYFALAVVVTMVQLSLEFFQEKGHLTEQVASMSGTVLPSLSDALWNFDEEQVQTILEGFNKNKEIFGIKVNAGSGEFYGVGEYIDDDGVRINRESKLLAGSDASQVQIYDQLYDMGFTLYSPKGTSEIIGSMRVYYSSSTVIERTYQTFVITITMACIKTLGLWLLAINIINRVVAKPIKKLQEDIIHFDIDEISDETYLLPEKEKLKVYNELEYLMECFTALEIELGNRNRVIGDHTQELQTKVQEKTQNLSAALQELTHSNKVQSEFLSNVSHELRTPLNSIIGFTQRVIKKYQGELDERAIEGLKMVHCNGENLLTLVNDLLDLSKIESGEVELEIVDADIKLLIHDVIQAVEPLATDKNITLEIDELVIDRLAVDPHRFKKILLNLMGNAIKFSDKGKVKLVNRLVEKQGVKGLEIKVIDDGVGVSEEDLPHLFDRFKQFTADNNATPGTGLGLAIANELMELHGGDIRAESLLGVGSQFIIWFPLENEISTASHVHP